MLANGYHALLWSVSEVSPEAGEPRATAPDTLSQRRRAAASTTRKERGWSGNVVCRLYSRTSPWKVKCRNAGRPKGPNSKRNARTRVEMLNQQQLLVILLFSHALVMTEAQSGSKKFECWKKIALHQSGMWPAGSDADQWRWTSTPDGTQPYLSNTFSLLQLCNVKMHCLKCLLGTVFVSHLAPNSTEND